MGGNTFENTVKKVMPNETKIGGNQMISYYELLGMIKKVKFPSMVKYNDKTYIWTGRYYRRIGADNYLSGDIDEVDMVEQNIEIIENNKQIEKLKDLPTLSETELIFVKKINEIIEVLNEKEKI